MAQVSRWIVFFRAFMVTLILGVPTTGARAQATDGEDWAGSVQEGTAEGYYRYLRRNPTGQHIQEAISALRRLGALGSGSVRAIPRMEGPAGTTRQGRPATATGRAQAGAGGTGGGTGAGGAGPSGGGGTGGAGNAGGGGTGGAGNAGGPGGGGLY
jgi:hypothetical protein